ncbi:hypothetical protein ACN28S_37235 [Cystobacter fuscus]
MLMSLTMLLLTLMVCVTLSFSMRVREKMEAQSIADRPPTAARWPPRAPSTASP